MLDTRFPEIFETLLRERGITEEEREVFFNPDYQRLHDPMLLPDMEKAAWRVIDALKNDEHITVFSDYDADGIPGAVVLSDFFKRIKYQNVSFYIPHRHDEGYGLNLDAIAEIAERGAKLMITVDCGITDTEEIREANRLGMDVIITDHHEPMDVLPEAYAVVNPKRRDSQYPFDGICGSAVAYKLVQATLSLESFGVKPGLEKWSLDMVGIATLSDMVPLRDENRILARFGLEVLKKSPRPGFESLFKRVNLNRKFLTEDDITFMITPRINAASRMGVPQDAFNLLSTDDPEEAERLAEHLEKINNERKGVVASMVKAAKEELDKRDDIKSVIVIGNPEWKPSLLGLVCNSLVEEYSRPAFVWGRDGDGALKGSCRSYDGYDLHALMTEAKDSFLEFGGHKGAGGFSISLDELPHLEEKLSSALSKLSSNGEAENGGLPISIADISEDLWQTVSMFAPFGMGNEKPVFKIPQAEIKSVKRFGKESNHLEVTLPRGIKAISFFSSPESFDAPLSPGAKVDLHAHLEKSYFRNRPEVRLRIVSISA